MAHFVPSNLKVKCLDPGEPKWVSLERKRHFFDNAHVAAHLEGPSVSVTSEEETRLLCTKGDMFDCPVGRRRWFPDWDHLRGAGVDKIVDLAPRATDLAQHDESERHRKWFPDQDHLRGAGIDTILDLTPRAKGKYVPISLMPKAGQEFRWWEMET